MTSSRHRFMLLGAALLLLALAGCAAPGKAAPEDTDTDPDPAPDKVTGLSVTPLELMLVVGAETALTSGQLTATAQHESGQVSLPGEVTWLSSNEQVATVSSQGLVSAVGPGTSTLFAHAAGFAADARVTVLQTPVSLRIEPGPVIDLSLGAGGEPVQLGAWYMWRFPGVPDLEAVDVSWSIDDTDVASIDSDGILIARAPGTVTVTAVAGAPELVASVQVTVSDPIVRVALFDGSDRLSASDTCALDLSLDDRTSAVLGAWFEHASGVLTASSGSVVEWSAESEPPAYALGSFANSLVTVSALIPGTGTISVAARSDAQSFTESIRVCVLDAATSGPSVVGGEVHSLAIRPDGALYSWGNNAVGQLGLGDTSTRSTPEQLRLREPFTQIAAGGSHTLGITGAGALQGWGSNDYGQLGLGDVEDRDVPVAIGLKGTVTQVAAGYDHSMAVTQAGQLFVWGRNNEGQLGTGDLIDVHEPRLLELGEPVTRIAAGRRFSFAITRGGALWAWGSNSAGQLGTGDQVDRPEPAAVQLVSPVTMVAAGESHTLAITQGGVLNAWGLNVNGALGTGAQSGDTMTPVVVQIEVPVHHISAGVRHSLAIGTDGRLFAWGANDVGQVGNDSEFNQPVPVHIDLGNKVIHAAAGRVHTLVLTQDYRVFSWGANDDSQLGRSTPNYSGEPGEVTF